MGRRAVRARIAVAAAVLLAAGCGDSGSPKPGKSSQSPARVTKSFSPDELKAMLLTDADVLGTTINRDEESTDITATEDAKVSSGGAGCQKFVDATELIASLYGTTAQANRDLLGANDDAIRYDLTLATLTGSGATQVLTDLRAGLKACPGPYTIDLGFGIASYTENELKVDPVGDSAFGYLEHTTLADATSSLEYLEFVQVGSVVVEVRVYPMAPGHGDPNQLQAQLATVVKAQVGRLTQDAAP